MSSGAGSQSSGGKLGIVSSLNTAGPVRYAQRPAVQRIQSMGGKHRATRPARLASDHQLPRTVKNGRQRTPEHASTSTPLTDRVAALEEVESLLATEFEARKKILPTVEEEEKPLPTAVEEELSFLAEEEIKYSIEEEDTCISPPPAAAGIRSTAGEEEMESLPGLQEPAVEPSSGAVEGVESCTAAESVPSPAPMETQDEDPTPQEQQSLAVSYCYHTYIMYCHYDITGISSI